MSNYNTEKVDNAVLALLCLTMFQDHGITRAWKGHAWEVLDRLYQKGYIDDPKNKNRSVTMTQEGVQQAQKLFEELFSNASYRA